MPSQLQVLKVNLKQGLQKGSNTLYQSKYLTVPYSTFRFQIWSWKNSSTTLSYFHKHELKSILKPTIEPTSWKGSLWTNPSPKKQVVMAVAFRSFFVQLWLFTQLSSGSAANEAARSSLMTGHDAKDFHVSTVNQTLLRFHYNDWYDWLKGILIMMAYYNPPYNWVV